MIRETYKGRQLKATKGKSYGKSRILVNGTECGEWLGTQVDVIEWAKRTIDDVDSRPFEGRWAECWYEPGTYELNEIGHVAAPGGVCSCDLCKTEPWNSCQNITAGGVCVCDHCMKPYRAEKPAAAEVEEVATQTETAETVAMPALTWVDTTDRYLRPYAHANRWEIAANGTTYTVERSMSAYHIWNDGEWLGMHGNKADVEAAITALAAAEEVVEEVTKTEETSDADVVKAFEAKADEIAKANGWTISHAETVMLRYLRDTSPAEAATIAEALLQRTRQAA
jgi:predicted heme/steroid binding protein